jgi:thioredoxin 1
LVKEVNRDNFDGEALQSKGAILVDFWGPQCKPCLALMPAVEKLEQEYAGRLKIIKVNAVENRMLCAKLRVLSLPTFLVYKDGIEMNRLVGDHVTKSHLLEAIAAVVT